MVRAERAGGQHCTVPSLTSGTHQPSALDGAQLHDPPTPSSPHATTPTPPKPRTSPGLARWGSTPQGPTLAPASGPPPFIQWAAATHAWPPSTLHARAPPDQRRPASRSSPTEWRSDWIISTRRKCPARRSRGVRDTPEARRTPPRPRPRPATPSHSPLQRSASPPLARHASPAPPSHTPALKDTSRPRWKPNIALYGPAALLLTEGLAREMHGREQLE
ncbi:extensin-like [Portunus trituberculatus]|uniref:extensin-like n=1 Tax=Portunus trituberculatus TaxID=210409 RepID=UPI001E1CC651|nr:extensin-like [Portunus trituberculatus]